MKKCGKFGKHNKNLLRKYIINRNTQRNMCYLRTCSFKTRTRMISKRHHSTIITRLMFIQTILFVHITVCVAQPDVYSSRSSWRYDTVFHYSQSMMRSIEVINQSRSIVNIVGLDKNNDTSSQL